MTYEECVEFLVNSGIPLEEARESVGIFLSLADRMMAGQDVTQENPSFYVANMNAQERYVLGPVLIPNHLDTWGTFFPPTTVKNAAYKFMADYQQNKFMHTIGLDKESVSIVESYLAPVDMIINGDVIQEGTWMMGIVVHNDEIWEHIKNGTLRGFSIGADVISGAISLRKSEE